MIPDEYLAANISKESGIEVVTHPGRCEVHERFTPGDIAQILSLSPRTVNKHLEHVFIKLGVENRAAATALATQALG